MKTSLRSGLLATSLAAALWGTGCDSMPGPPPADTAKPAAKTTGEKDAHAGHDHAGHDHAHAETGPHGGHIAEVGEEEFHAEWTHDDATGKVTVYVLDSTMKKEVPIAAEKIVIETKVGEKTASYDLAAANRTTGDKPTAFQFEIEDKALLGTLESLSKGVTATLKMDINGKMFDSIKLEAEAEHDHKH